MEFLASTSHVEVATLDFNYYLRNMDFPQKFREYKSLVADGWERPELREELEEIVASSGNQEWGEQLYEFIQRTGL